MPLITPASGRSVGDGDAAPLSSFASSRIDGRGVDRAMCVTIGSVSAKGMELASAVRENVTYLG